MRPRVWIPAHRHRHGGDVLVTIGTIALQPLTVLALAGVGAASGLLITDVRVVATLSQLSSFVVMFARRC